jgi:hypothetical protein
MFAARHSVALLHKAALILCVAGFVCTTVNASTVQGLYVFDTLASTGGPYAGLASTPTYLGVPSINSSGIAGFPCSDSAGNTICTGGGSAGIGVAAIAGFPEGPETYENGVAIDDSGNVTVTRLTPGPYTDISSFNSTTTLVSTIATGHFETCPGLSCLDYDFDAVFGDVNANNSGQFVFVGLDRHTDFSDACAQTACLATPTGESVFASKFNELPITSPARPVLADNGTVVLRYQATALTPPIVPVGTRSIRSYDYTLSRSTTVADESGPWVANSLGMSPGVSADGVAIAFSGNRGAAEGVFLSLQMPDGSSELVRVAGEGQPDLGYSRTFEGTPAPIFFSSFAQDSRIGVVHRSVDPTTMVGDVFIVAFIATPSAASPLPGSSADPKDTNQLYVPGMFFTAQQGLWTVKVQVVKPGSSGSYTCPSSGTSPAVCECPTGSSVCFLVNMPIKVLQEGDPVPGGNGLIVDTAQPGSSTIQLYDPISLTPLTDPLTEVNAGNHQLAFSITADEGAVGLILRATQTDTCVLSVSRLPQGSTKLPTNAPWSTDIYDGSEYCTIAQKGCALTSLATILNYAAAMPGKAGPVLPTDPGSLNTLLKASDAYSGPVTNDMPNCPSGITQAQSVVFGQDAKVATSANGSPSMKWSDGAASVFGSNYSNPSDPGYSAIKNNMCSIGSPMIIGVKLNAAHNNSPNHYVVATGIANGKVLISDPGDIANTVLENSYSANASGYIFATRGSLVDPSNSSMLSISSSSDVVIDVVDANGNHDTYNAASGSTIQNIPNSAAYQDGTDDPTTGAIGSEYVTVIDIQTLAPGAYSVNVTSIDGALFDISVFYADSNGTAYPPQTISGTVATGETKSYKIIVPSSPGTGVSVESPGAVTVPNIVGDSLTAATSALVGVGLAVGTITQQPSGTVPAGTVLSSNPAAGTSVSSGSAVSLIESSGAATCAELQIVKAAFGSKLGQRTYNPQADVNADGVVNVLDLSIVARALPAGTTCP